MIIVSFVGTNIPTHNIIDLVVLLNATMKTRKINFCMDVSRMFLHLNFTMPKGMKKNAHPTQDVMRDHNLPSIAPFVQSRISSKSKMPSLEYH
jgi:hypothetical protein